ncbi:PLP-dependent aminotransferase family protein [Paenibacillus sp.]|uniref:MocR-like pyridoxine biosynthesis transcription factor PdxR n=1 Tax=Paenibacillus sp. TaxID=58172 RepID=UPI002D38B32D|nr:PLP-dependent aminotransferase family protein [Paenibacillus sp.]HZG85745.1 PLP-dependent aminotransferase family protein [Paenibacillus sp.]
MDLTTAFETYAQEHRQKYMALYLALRDAIVHGRLAPGERLPSSRALAADYGLSRGTVNAAYDLLAGEGYVTSGVGRGTFVSRLPAGEGAATAERSAEAVPPRLSAWGARAVSLPPRERAAHGFAVHYGTAETDAAAFPAAEWHRAMYAAARASAAHGAAFDARGWLPLREAVARHLGRARGIAATAEQVVIVNGSMQALALLVQLLVDPGDPVVIEHPGYGGIRRAVLAAGAEPVPAAVDERGLVPAPWRARLLVATPNRQFPTGAVMPLERRLALLRWAAGADAWVVEDDYDSEFRRAGRPVEPLKSLDAQGRVVFVGTFSRTMYTGLRLGYAVLPDALLPAFLALKGLYEPHPTAMTEQRAMAEFMKNGGYERHLRRMKRLYSRKYEALIGGLREKLAHAFATQPQDAGLHVYARWTGSREAYLELIEACARRGVTWTDVSYCDASGEPVCAAAFGFSGLTIEQIRFGLDVIAQAEAEGLGSRKGGIRSV